MCFSDYSMKSPRIQPPVTRGRMLTLEWWPGVWDILSGSPWSWRWASSHPNGLPEKSQILGNTVRGTWMLGRLPVSIHHSHITHGRGLSLTSDKGGGVLFPGWAMYEYMLCVIRGLNLCVPWAQICNPRREQMRPPSKPHTFFFLGHSTRNGGFQ